MSKAAVDHFSTEHLKHDLRGRSVRGGVWTLGGQGGKFLLQIVSVAVLARLLTPKDFGLVAMVTAITGFVAMFKDAGLSMATIQRDTITHEQISTLFWVNIALSAGLMLVTAALAPLIARFYGEPRLVPITLAFAGIFLLTGLSIQHRALLRRQMRFGALAVISLAAAAAGVAAAIVSAALGLGYWALVIQAAVGAAVNVSMDWLLCRWRPGRPTRGSGVRPMLAFGGHLTGFSFINYFARNADNVLIGWWWGAGPLGFYSKAYGLLMLPIQQVNGPATAVALPALCRLQSDPERFKRFYYKAIGLITFIGMPVVAFLFVEARDVILLVMGDQWLAAVPIFQALSVAAFVGTFNVAGGWVFTALGRTDRMLKWSLIVSPIIVGSFVAGLPWGAMGVAVCYSAALLFIAPLSVAYSFRGTFLRYIDFVKAIFIPAIAAIIAGVLTGLLVQIGAMASLAVIVRLLLAGLAYLAIYIGLWSITASGRERLAEIFILIRNILPKAPKESASGTPASVMR